MIQATREQFFQVGEFIERRIETIEEFPGRSFLYCELRFNMDEIYNVFMKNVLYSYTVFGLFFTQTMKLKELGGLEYCPWWENRDEALINSRVPVNDWVTIPTSYSFRPKTVSGGDQYCESNCFNGIEIYPYYRDTNKWSRYTFGDYFTQKYITFEESEEKTTVQIWGNRGKYVVVKAYVPIYELYTIEKNDSSYNAINQGVIPEGTIDCVLCVANSNFEATGSIRYKMGFDAFVNNTTQKSEDWYVNYKRSMSSSFIEKPEDNNIIPLYEVGSDHDEVQLMRDWLVPDLKTGTNPELFFNLPSIYYEWHSVPLIIPSQGPYSSVLGVLPNGCSMTKSNTYCYRTNFSISFPYILPRKDTSLYYQAHDFTFKDEETYNEIFKADFSDDWCKVSSDSERCLTKFKTDIENINLNFSFVNRMYYTEGDYIEFGSGAKNVPYKTLMKYINNMNLGMLTNFGSTFNTI